VCLTDVGTVEKAPSVSRGTEKSPSAREVEEVLSVVDMLRTPSAHGSQKSVLEKALSAVGSQRAESSAVERESAVTHEAGLYIILSGIFFYCTIREAMENHDIVSVLMENCIC